MHWFMQADPQVQAAFVSGLFLLLGGGATGIFAILRLLVAQHRVVREVKHQVKNSHDTNLRDDLDVIRDDIREVLRVSQANTGAIQLLHQDIRDEREKRVRLEGRLEVVERDPHGSHTHVAGVLVSQHSTTEEV